MRKVVVIEMKDEKLRAIVWPVIMLYFLLAAGGCAIGLVLAFRK